MPNPHPKASIILLTRNSSKTIKGVLEGIAKQTFTNYETLIIDSSSTDETINIANNYKCEIITINPIEFGHGKTRNYAAKLAKGDIVVFLTHDSVPRRESWLSEMLKPFSNQKIVGVYGQQIPRPKESVLDKHFQMSLYGGDKIVWESDNWQEGDNIFSDANSAVRKSTLLKYPYAKNIIVSEDYEWAMRVLEMGYKIIYSPSAQVTHSHSYNIRNLFKRNFDIGVSYKVIYKSSDFHHFISKGIKISLQEVKYLAISGHARLIPSAIFRDCVRFTAIQFGKHEKVFSTKFKRKHLSSQGWYWK